MNTLIRDTINDANHFQPHSQGTNLFILSDTDPESPGAVLYLQKGDFLWCPVHPALFPNRFIDYQCNDDGYPTRDTNARNGGIPIRGLFISQKPYSYTESINP